MYEGKPLLVVIGNSNTGRTPMAAGLLRQALGAYVIVQTAGVLSHDGDGVTTEAQMALEQWGIDISSHRSQPLGPEQHRDADLLLAIDSGTASVLHAELPHDERICTLSALTDLPDVLDPHRMPLGVWITVAQQLRQQVDQALPVLERRLGINQEIPSTNTSLTIKQAEATSHDLQQSHAETIATSSQASPSHAEHLERITRLLITAQTLPEIVDWIRLRHELTHELRMIGQAVSEPTDLIPAAILMLEGKLMRYETQPSSKILSQIKQATQYLRTPLGAEALAELGSNLIQ
jgi:protein-tyrosine-phosphatase